jgi:hypothetical protein
MSYQTSSSTLVYYHVYLVEIERILNTEQREGDNLLIVCIWGFRLFLEGKESTQQCQ